MIGKKLTEISQPLTVMVYGNRVTLTQETIDKTCQWYADNAQGCIDEVLSGKVKVNDQDHYISEKQENIKNYKSKNFPLTLAFYQKAVYIQTGATPPLL